MLESGVVHQYTQHDKGQCKHMLAEKENHTDMVPWARLKTIEPRHEISKNLTF